ncbi:Hypothetical predicted protein, partial [Paramuricea clavata]
MATRSHASKRAAQISTNTRSKTPKKPVLEKAKKTINANKEDRDNLHEEKPMNVENMFETIMSKLEYAYAEVETLKKENAEPKKSDSETKERLAKVEEQNSALNSRVIDLQA